MGAQEIWGSRWRLHQSGLNAKIEQSKEAQLGPRAHRWLGGVVWLEGLVYHLNFRSRHESLVYNSQSTESEPVLSNRFPPALTPFEYL